MVIWVLLVLITAPFFLIVLRGAPYVPTKRRYAEAALDLLDLKPGQVLLELGCGDGVVLIAGAKRGIKVVGYELNPYLWLVTRLRTRRFGKLVAVKFGDYYLASLPKADGVFVFQAKHAIQRLEKKLKTQHGLKVASIGFALPNHQPVKKSGPVALYRLK